MQNNRQTLLLTLFSILGLPLTTSILYLIGTIQNEAYLMYFKLPDPAAMFPLNFQATILNGAMFFGTASSLLWLIGMIAMLIAYLKLWKILTNKITAFKNSQLKTFFIFISITLTTSAFFFISFHYTVKYARVSGKEQAKKEFKEHKYYLIKHFKQIKQRPSTVNARHENGNLYYLKNNNVPVYGFQVAASNNFVAIATYTGNKDRIKFATDIISKSRIVEIKAANREKDS